MLLLVLAISSVFSNSLLEEQIKNQYIIRVDEQVLTAQSDLDVFANMLKTSYNIDTIKNFDFGSVKLMHIAGDYNNVMKINALSVVKYVEKNQIVQASCETQSAAGCWGLDRTDQREKLPYTDPINPDATYVWGENIGTDVVAYVADTGIDYTDPEFEGRASHGYTAGDIPNPEDVNGHGTHCAGTIGSASYGIAKGVTLVAVKVLRDSGFGSTNGIVDGLNWILSDHQSRGENAKSVVNLSLGGSASQAIDDATQGLIDGGVIVVVAAGNFNNDACNYSPARLPDAITVGATAVNDETWESTNYGTCVDIFGPGSDILSTTPGHTTAVYSGTSMATPHVVGVAARYLERNTAVNQAQVCIFKLCKLNQIYRIFLYY